jgi:hypothetical protein
VSTACRAVAEEFHAARRILERLPTREVRPAQTRTRRRLEEAATFAIEDGEVDAARVAVDAWKAYSLDLLHPDFRSQTDKRVDHLGVEPAPRVQLVGS